jgi:hypothetical protein
MVVPWRIYKSTKLNLLHLASCTAGALYVYYTLVSLIYGAVDHHGTFDVMVKTATTMFQL